MTRQKNKRGDRQRELNDSSEIPDRAGDIRHPQPPFGDCIKYSERMKYFTFHTCQLSYTVKLLHCSTAVNCKILKHLQSRHQKVGCMKEKGEEKKEGLA